MLLSIIKSPQWMLWYRPEFTLIILIYWALLLPDRCGLWMAALVGLFQDSITASYLGQHILIYSIVIVFILFSYQRLRMMGVWQQTVVIFILLFMQQIIEYFVAVIMGQPRLPLWYVLPSISGALLWPILVIFLRIIRKKMRILNNNI
jgi:rod shape-determining protein MreD